MEPNLVVPAESQVESPRSPLLTIDGKPWVIAGPISLANLHKCPEFTCVSYVWGRRRTQNPAFPNREMSHKTLSALRAAIKLSTTTAFWIDAFCVPFTQPARGATLESMGFIYNAAKDVFVVLSVECRAIVYEMGASDMLNQEQLLVLESDEWIRSVWTYQEVVNSKRLFFTTSDPDSHALVDGADFLNRVGYSFERLRREQGMNVLALRRLYPRLDAFQELISDWMTGGYSHRSALQVMANLDLRVSAGPASYFYSMIGSISTERSVRSAGDAVEECMALCEQKGDYSFIYSSTERDRRVGRRWRPRPGSLLSILQWHGWGSQGGYRDSNGLWLQDMFHLEQETALGEIGRECALKWLNNLGLRDLDPSTCTDGEVVGAALAFLRGVGFRGSGDYLLTSHGIMFPWEKLEIRQNSTFVVSYDLRWSFGSPFLAVTFDGDSKQYTPGVFVGARADVRISDFLLDDSEI